MFSDWNVLFIIYLSTLYNFSRICENIWSLEDLLTLENLDACTQIKVYFSSIHYLDSSLLKQASSFVRKTASNILKDPNISLLFYISVESIKCSRIEKIFDMHDLRIDKWCIKIAIDKMTHFSLNRHQMTTNWIISKTSFVSVPK